METQKALLELGFDKNTAAVYYSLLGSGSSKAGDIIKRTRLHRMIVYEALEKLADQGLVSVVREKKVKIFQPSSPTSLLERSHRIGKVTEMVVADLKRLQGESRDIVDVRTFVGTDGFRESLQIMVESAARDKGKVMCVIGGAKDTDFYDAAGAWYETYARLCAEGGVKKKLLAPDPHAEGFRKQFAAEPNTELRTLKAGLSSPTYTRITKEMVSIEIYRPKIVIIQIRNSVIAQSYLDSFKIAWAAAK